MVALQNGVYFWSKDIRLGHYLHVSLLGDATDEEKIADVWLRRLIAKEDKYQAKLDELLAHQPESIIDDDRQSAEKRHYRHRQMFWRTLLHVGLQFSVLHLIVFNCAFGVAMVALPRLDPPPSDTIAYFLPAPIGLRCIALSALICTVAYCKTSIHELTRLSWAEKKQQSEIPGLAEKAWQFTGNLFLVVTFVFVAIPFAGVELFRVSFASQSLVAILMIGEWAVRSSRMRAQGGADGRD